MGRALVGRVVHVQMICPLMDHLLVALRILYHLMLCYNSYIHNIPSEITWLAKKSPI